MKKKYKSDSIANYGANVALGGIMIGSIESAGNTGTSIAPTYMNVMSKPIGTMASLKGTKMVMGSLKQLKIKKAKRR